MKVVLVQLPVPDNRLANLPLALGYLKAAAEAANLPGVKIELLDATAMNRGGDAFVTEAILQRDPDLVGFSLYTWNSSRVLKIARALKKRAPEILLLGGGPEVNRDGDFVLSSPHFDFLALGEGERTFVELLRRLTGGAASRGLEFSGGLARGLAVRNPSGGQWLFGEPQTALDDVNSVPSAYLGGALEGHVGRYMSIELSRWCPSRCTFCYYGRQDIPRGGKRYFDLERVRQELLWGMERGVEQIHFVEANFNTLPHLSQIYQTIKATGANRRFSFYAELRGEAIDPAHAATLAECNFGTVEVGLQSAVPEVMAQVKRKNHLPRLVAGVHNLRAQGIEVFLDVILGLPGETPATFRRTLDFMDEQNLHPYDMFHLQILSGTELKAQALAGQHGLKWQAAPPYFVLATDQLSFEDLCQLRREAFERKHDAHHHAIPGHTAPGHFALARPFVSAEQNIIERELGNTPIERVYLDFSVPLPENSSAWDDLAKKLSSQVDLWLKLDTATPEKINQACQILQKLSRPNPSGVWNIFLETLQPLPLESLAALRQAIYHEEDYLDRLAVFAYETPEINSQAWPSVRLYQLLPFNPAWQPQTNLIWQLNLSADDAAEVWQNQLTTALETACVGIQINPPENCKPGKLKQALQGVTNPGKQIWLAEVGLAMGLAFATAEDNAALTALTYPPTVVSYANNLNLLEVDRNRLLDAAFRWARS